MVIKIYCPILGTVYFGKKLIWECYLKSETKNRNFLLCCICLTLSKVYFCQLCVKFFGGLHFFWQDAVPPPSHNCVLHFLGVFAFFWQNAVPPPSHSPLALLNILRMILLSSLC